MSGTRADARKSREDDLYRVAPDERAREDRLRVRRHQRRREVAQQALECVMSGASFDDADALLLAFEDLNARLEVQP